MRAPKLVHRSLVPGSGFGRSTAAKIGGGLLLRCGVVARDAGCGEPSRTAGFDDPAAAAGGGAIEGWAVLRRWVGSVVGD